MMRRSSVWMVAGLCTTLVLALGGCKKKDKDPPAKADDKSMAVADGDMTVTDPMKVTPDPPKPNPDVAAPAGRAGALPVAFDQPLAHLDLKALRGTELYKKYEPQLKAMFAKLVTEQPIAKALVEKCKFDPLTTLESISGSMAIGGGKSAAGVVIVKGTFESAKLLECAKAEATAAQMAPAALTLAGKTGLTFKVKEGMHVIALDGATLLFFNEEQKERVEAVLSGKVGSIEDSAFYKEMNGQVKAGVTVFSGLMPKLPESLPGPLAMIARNVKGAGVMIGLPEGGLDLKLAINLGDEKQASTLAAMVMANLGSAKAIHPLLGELAQKLQIKAEGPWIRASLVLDKAAFEGLLAAVAEKFKGGIMGSIFGAGTRKGEEPKTDAMGPDDGMKADEGMKAGDGMKVQPRRPADMK